MKYAPKVQITIIEGALDTGRIPEGNIVSFLCTADANPNNLTYRWYINDDAYAHETSKTLVYPLTRTFFFY